MIFELEQFNRKSETFVKVNKYEIKVTDAVVIARFSWLSETWVNDDDEMMGKKHVRYDATSCISVKAISEVHCTFEEDDVQSHYEVRAYCYGSSIPSFTVRFIEQVKAFTFMEEFSKLTVDKYGK